MTRRYFATLSTGRSVEIVAESKIDAEKAANEVAALDDATVVLLANGPAIVDWEKPSFTMDELAEALCRHRSSIKQMEAAGELNAAGGLNRTTYPRAELIRLLEVAA